MCSEMGSLFLGGQFRKRKKKLFLLALFLLLIYGINIFLIGSKGSDSWKIVSKIYNVGDKDSGRLLSYNVKDDNYSRQLVGKSYRVESGGSRQLVDDSYNVADEDSRQVVSKHQSVIGKDHVSPQRVSEVYSMENDDSGQLMKDNDKKADESIVGFRDPLSLSGGEGENSKHHQRIDALWKRQKEGVLRAKNNVFKHGVLNRKSRFTSSREMGKDKEENNTVNSPTNYTITDKGNWNNFSNMVASFQSQLLQAQQISFRKMQNSASQSDRNTPKHLQNVQHSTQTVELKPPTALTSAYIIKNPHFCKNVTRINLLVIVPSSPKNRKQRQFIRKTWGQRGLYLPLSVRVLFTLGSAGNFTNRKLKEESNMFDDILQGDFIDSYKNLTNKGIMAFRWITEYCSNVDMVAKIDDDVLPNTFLILEKLLPYMQKHKRTFICNHNPNNSMPIIRDESSELRKWYVGPGNFVGLSTYPTQYCSGYAVFMSGDLVPLLYSAARYTDSFWIEDVYLYGLIARYIPNIQYIGADIYMPLDPVYSEMCIIFRHRCRNFVMILTDPFVLWRAVLKSRHKPAVRSTKKVNSFG